MRRRIRKNPEFRSYRVRYYDTRNRIRRTEIVIDKLFANVKDHVARQLQKRRYFSATVDETETAPALSPSMVPRRGPYR